MTAVIYEGQRVPLEPDDSVLDALLRAGIEISHACRSGICHSCIVQLDHDADTLPQLNPEAQSGLSTAQKAQQQVLSCQCKPGADIKLAPVGAMGGRDTVVVLDKTWLGDAVIGLRLARPEGFTYRAGQYLTVWRKQEGRCYSIASVAEQDDDLALHVRVYPNGAVSQWLAHNIEAGQRIDISGPAGGCFYQAQPEQAMLLLAVGTGLAPILGVLRDAQQRAHRGEIHVLVAARSAHEFYALDALRSCVAGHANVNITLVCAAPNSEVAVGLPFVHDDIYEYVQQHYKALQGWQIYVCGRDSFVRKLKRQCFMAGAAMNEIFADSFVSAGDASPAA